MGSPKPPVSESQEWTLIPEADVGKETQVITLKSNVVWFLNTFVMDKLIVIMVISVVTKIFRFISKQTVTQEQVPVPIFNMSQRKPQLTSVALTLLWPQPSITHSPSLN